MRGIARRAPGKKPGRMKVLRFLFGCPEGAGKRRRPGLPCFRMVNVPNTQKSEKVRWGRGDLCGLFLLATFSEPYIHSETAIEKVGVRPMSVCNIATV